MVQFLNQVLQNSVTLKSQIGQQTINTKDFFIDNQQQDSVYENKLYLIVLGCLQGEQSQKINTINEKYKDYFEESKYVKIQYPIITKLVNQQDQQIQSLKYFIAEVIEQLENIIKNLEQYCKINQSSLRIQGQLDQIRFIMNGCQETCPVCKRKCDLDNEKHDKHMCQNGHQLRGMNGVLIENKPSLYTCEEISDDALIITLETNQTRTWSDIVKIYPEWQFKSLQIDDIQQNKMKMMKVWNEGIGQSLCNWFTNQLNREVHFEKKHEQIEQSWRTQPIHYIFILDDSGSMKGQKWQNVRNGAISCMTDVGQNPNARVSVIIFNEQARLVIDCQKVNISHQNQQIQFMGGNTDFSKAFDLTLIQIQKYKFDQTIILFYTDGGASYPQKEIAAFSKLEGNTKKSTTLIACTEEKVALVLSQIVDQLKPHLLKVELKDCLQTSAIKQAWCEIVSQNYHKLRC